MSAIPLPDMDTPPDDDQRRMAIPVDNTSELEQRGLASHMNARPIPMPQQTTGTSDLENRALSDHLAPRAIPLPQENPDDHPMSTPIQTGVASLWARAHNIHNPVLRVLGEIGAGGARALDTIGTIVAPKIAGSIPGTTVNAALQNQNQVKSAQEQAGLAKAQAATEHEKAETGAIPARTGLETAQTAKTEAETAEVGKPKEKEEKWANVTGLTGPNGEPVEQEANSGQYRFGDLAGVKQTKQPSETQIQNKLEYQGTIGKVAGAGLPTDPKSIDKSLDAALKKGTITPQEHAAAKAYESANTTPGTNLTVHLAGEQQANSDAINKLFEGKEVLAHMPDGSRVQMSYDEAKKQGIPPERLVALNANEAQQNRDKHASTGATFQSLANYRTDFKNNAPKLSTQDRDAMRVLSSHAQDGTTAGILGNLVDELPIAGPLSSYANKLLQGTMTSDQYKQLSPDGKKLVSDYFTAIIANFANMKNIMGSVGRNPMQLQAEINTIPLPYLDWNSANEAFENKRSDLQRRASSQPIIQGAQQ